MCPGQILVFAYEKDDCFPKIPVKVPPEKRLIRISHLKRLELEVGVRYFVFG
jgi:hypothetical protein